MSPYLFVLRRPPSEDSAIWMTAPSEQYFFDRFPLFPLFSFLFCIFYFCEFQGMLTNKWIIDKNQKAYFGILFWPLTQWNIQSLPNSIWISFSFFIVLIWKTKVHRSNTIKNNFPHKIIKKPRLLPKLAESQIIMWNFKDQPIIYHITHNAQCHQICHQRLAMR